MRKAIDFIFLLAVLAFAAYLAYTHQTQVKKIEEMLNLRSPCASPATYSIISIDRHFGIATSTLVRDLGEAEAIWEKPSGRDLFAYQNQGGDVSIRLVYDERQAATDKLSTLGAVIDQKRASYDDLKSRYETLKQQVYALQSNYDNKVAQFHADESAYNAEVQRWNSEGGAPPSEYQALNSKKQKLADEFAAVKSVEQNLNSSINTLNAYATELNQLIVRLNLNVRQYNTTGTVGGEFEEGLYSENNGVQTIDIYEFSSHTQLVRVLAHELGHALGMDHVADRQAIMYKLNDGNLLQATPDDIAELHRVCKFK
jgi:hypothetical protein